MLYIYDVQNSSYSKVKRGEKKEPVRKVNRYKQNCPLQDNLHNIGMTKWNCEKVPFCTVQHLNVYLINSITIADSAKNKKKVW
jgi:hypothetical protein